MSMASTELVKLGQRVKDALAGKSGISTGAVFALVNDHLPGEGQQKWAALRKLAERGFPGAEQGEAKTNRYGKTLRPWLWSEVTDWAFDEWAKTAKDASSNSPYNALAERLARLEEEAADDRKLLVGLISRINKLEGK